jgi:PiT family inorganic phosphate transporter
MASPASALVAEKLNKKTGKFGMVFFGVAVVAGLSYIVSAMAGDLSVVKAAPYLLLGVALITALAFEFVNGFHDTANAVATVIYTHSLDPQIAVVWSGFCNFVGVLMSSGGVAFGIISLLPVELIIQVGGGAGFSMVFALLIAAILWNIGTWWLGLPASSSHTMVGSIIGVGIANQLMSTSSGTSGVDWEQAMKVGQSLLISPLIGFALAAVLLIAFKLLIKDKRLYEAPAGDVPPPIWIRSLLVFTCSGVSYLHGSNDGQKGMGLIMLILVGTVPTAYALNHAISPAQSVDFVAVSQQTAGVVNKYVKASAVEASSREELTDYIRTRNFKDSTMLALRQEINDVSNEVAVFKDLKNVPPQRVSNLRNDMYVVSEALRLVQKNKNSQFTDDDKKVLANYKKHIDDATKFIPVWVKVAVALALGLGTMIGWKRIVVTVGEKIGKDHLTYGQGAAAEITAMATIYAADSLNLPVSTTHVLSSGIAGTMAANRTGLQMSTVRNLLMAWVLTLPAAMIMSGFLYWTFRTLSGS